MFLKLKDGSFIESSNNLVRSANKMEVAFQMPANLPITDKISEAVLLVNSPDDGAMIKPSAVSIRQRLFPVTPAKDGSFIKDPGKLH